MVPVQPKSSSAVRGRSLFATEKRNFQKHFNEPLHVLTFRVVSVGVPNRQEFDKKRLDAERTPVTWRFRFFLFFYRVSGCIGRGGILLYATHLNKRLAHFINRLVLKQRQSKLLKFHQKVRRYKEMLLTTSDDDFRVRSADLNTEADSAAGSCWPYMVRPCWRWRFYSPEKQKVISNMCVWDPIRALLLEKQDFMQLKEEKSQKFLHHQDLWPFACLPAVKFTRSLLHEILWYLFEN